jgi:hypothetical protein
MVMKKRKDLLCYYQRGYPTLNRNHNLRHTQYVIITILQLPPYLQYIFPVHERSCFKQNSNLGLNSVVDMRSSAVVAIGVGSGLSVVHGIRLALLMNHGITIVVLDREAEAGRVDILVAPQEESTEAWLG